jgi:hypothetical protein
MANIAIVVGHPQRDAYCEALGRAYQRGAESGGHKAKLFLLARMNFDAILREGYRREQVLEPDHCQHRSIMYATRFYSPQSEPMLDQYDSARGAAVDAITAFEKGKGGLKESNSAMILFEQTANKFKEEIIKQRQKYSDIEIFSEAGRALKRALTALRRK